MELDRVGTWEFNYPVGRKKNGEVVCSNLVCDITSRKHFNSVVNMLLGMYGSVGYRREV